MADSDIVDKVVIGIDVQTGQDLTAALSRSDIVTGNVSQYVDNIVNQMAKAKGGMSDQSILQGLNLAFGRLASLLSSNKITQSLFDSAKFSALNFAPFQQAIQSAGIGDLDQMLKNGLIDNGQYLQQALPQARGDNRQLKKWLDSGLINKSQYQQLLT